MPPPAPTPPELRIAPLDATLLADFSGFSCGDEPWQADLRDYLLEDALAQAQGRYNATYLFYTPTREAVGYVSLSAAQVNRADARIRPRAPYPFVPAMLVGRLGVDVRFQGSGYGRQIMGLVREWGRSLVAGCRIIALQVDIRNTGAMTFYERIGFTVPPIEVARDMRWMFYDLGER